ncbi:hypothetical protein Misp01_44920 [Microtetraspora sp. NBRC 13810]|uniref:hypothetical protein n=1 Tax=Microtetraspora sp. NBRC 13810 TaxID=3030990 RepID=UPI0024A57F9E|nr:hypothetical protein [Microtetraspora sp. NBRC 13810]GLW09363.1 hypothetical protein Misp01_44920 [Microtetraspora sp. NBRC 13810]
MSESSRRKSLRRKPNKEPLTAQSDTDDSETGYNDIDDFLEGADDLDMTSLTSELGTIGAGLDDLSFLLDDPPEPSDTGQRAPDAPGETVDLTLTRRTVHQRDDVGPGPRTAPVRITLTLRPDTGLDATLTRYRSHEDGTVSADAPDSIMWSEYENYQVDETTWARDSRGLPLVAARGRTPQAAPDESGQAPGPLFYFDRADLVESTYPKTKDAIDAEIAKGDEREADFWDKRKNEIQQLGHVLIPYPTDGVTTAEKTVKVPPGDYPLLKSRSFFDDKIAVGQLAPFSPIVKYGDGYVAISPDPMWTIRSDDAPEDEEKGAGRELTAKKIIDLFAASPRFRPHLPGPEWLRDDQIHYVTQEQLGAALVLERFTTDPVEIEAAKRQNAAAFELGVDTNGYHSKGHLYVKKSRRGTGVEYHEATHRLSHAAVKHVFGSSFNEGLTEYFTRPLVAQLVGAGEMPPRDAYEPQVQAIDALVRYAGVTEDQLAAAYFTGDLRPLYEQVAKAAVHPPFSPAEPFSLDAYAALLEDRHADEAREVLITACGPQPGADAPAEATGFEKTLKATRDTAGALVKDRRLSAGTRIELLKALNRADDAKTETDLRPLTTLVESANRDLADHWATPLVRKTADLLTSPQADSYRALLEPAYLKALADANDQAYQELASWVKIYNL